MDMGAVGASYFLYIWGPGETTPIRMRTSPYLTAVRFFPPKNSNMAIIDGDTLKVFSRSSIGLKGESSLP